MWAVLGALLLAVCAASGVLVGLTWHSRFSWSGVGGRGRGEGGGLRGGHTAVDPVVLVFLLAVPLLLGGALAASWRGQPAARKRVLL